MFGFWKTIQDGFLGGSTVKYVQNLDSPPIFSTYLSTKKQILTVSKENVERYESQTGTREFSSAVDHLKCCCFNLDLNVLVLGCLDQNIYVYDTKKDFSLKFKLSKHLGSVQVMQSVTPDLFLSGDSTGTVILWSLSNQDWV
jgi:WD40 repeat protein